ncbi:MAG: thioredoxin domain-containing protein [Clostridia bacterium]|nr:thioredoxin domain-containing protein [Clostridia bacterium]
MANRLRFAKSPYLLLHKDNPVSWYTWGAEAFEKAEAEDKPIFLSIGYSACHWCHRMAREAFSDRETAHLINTYFVPIKVDREERPDIDEVYMRFCQSMTGSGGWPLNLFLTPRGKPFFAGTYFPIKDSPHTIGFQTLLRRSAEAWSLRRQAVVDTAAKITDTLNRDDDRMYKEAVAPSSPQKACGAFASSFDRLHGGFGKAPKFPMVPSLMFLLAYGKKRADAEAVKMAETTLEKMHDGGLFDHVGGGFFRYATDREWRIPHYEKMLYDNALLSIAYLEAGGRFIPYAEETLHFLCRTMKGEGGGFYSAVSAESEEGEGSFYLWDEAEVRAVLGKEADHFIKTYHISARTLPYLSAPPSEDFSAALEKLYKRRQFRPLPDMDKKILTGQNALLATAFLKAALVTGKEAYRNSAEEILLFIEKNLRRADGRLLASFFEGAASVPAFSPDYAYLLWAQITLFEVTKNKEHLSAAMKTGEEIIRLFWKEEGGAYFIGRDAESLILRPMDGDDGAMPSANAVLALCFRKLFSITGDEQYKTYEEKIFFAFGGLINQYPEAYASMLYAFSAE